MALETPQPGTARPEAKGLGAKEEVPETDLKPFFQSKVLTGALEVAVGRALEVRLEEPLGFGRSQDVESVYLIIIDR